MRRDVRVVIVEDDPFARNWMVLVVVRDWRTRVIAEVDHPEDLLRYLVDKSSPVDFVILDTDIPGEDNWIPRVLKVISALEKPPRILCTGIRPNPNVLRQLSHPAFVGYVLKNEIGYSLAWAVSLAIRGTWVITDSIQALAASERFPLPKPCLVLNGKSMVGHLTERQADVARLALLFSIERRELADELGVGDDWSYQMVSEVYESLGIKDVLQDEAALQDYFGDYDLIMAYIERIKRETHGSGKSKDMETLAFHMMTMPEMKEIR